MDAVRSGLSVVQERRVLSLFLHSRLHLLYKASVHGYTGEQFHHRCDNQGPTLIAAYNKAGFVFGAYTAKNYNQTEELVVDAKAFLYSMSAGEEYLPPLRVASIDGQYGFFDGTEGPDFGALVFLQEEQAKIASDPGTGFNFSPKEMHGDDLDLTEFEVYRVEGSGFVTGLSPCTDLGGLLAKPWRSVQWTAERRQQLKRGIQAYQPEIDSVSKARVLLLGPVGAGKSSFFNSMNSVFRGNMTSQAICGTAGRSLTTQFRTYSIRAGKGGEEIPLILCDTMGLEEKEETGLDIEDLVNIYKGHIQDRYQFNSSTPIEPDAAGYKKKVTLKDRIHCVVYVFNTANFSILPDNMLKKIRAIRKKTNQLGIPQLLLMTKVDEACPLVAENLSNVYRSTYIQKKAQDLSAAVGIPLNCVMPVKNYSQELELEQNVDILLMSAVQQMLNYTDSFFENQVKEEGEEVAACHVQRVSLTNSLGL